MEYIWANISPESTILDTNVNIFSGHCRGLSATNKYRRLHYSSSEFAKILKYCMYTLLSNQTTRDVVLFWGVMAIIFIHCFFLTNKSKC